MNKQQMIDQLCTGICNVTFTKINGDTRVMPCTLVESDIPTEHKPTGAGKEKPDDLISVYVPDAPGWRSFKIANVTSFVNSIGEELYDI